MNHEEQEARTQVTSKLAALHKRLVSESGSILLLIQRLLEGEPTPRVLATVRTLKTAGRNLGSDEEAIVELLERHSSVPRSVWQAKRAERERERKQFETWEANREAAEARREDWWNDPSLDGDPHSEWHRKEERQKNEAARAAIAAALRQPGARPNNRPTHTDGNLVFLQQPASGVEERP